MSGPTAERLPETGTGTGPDAPLFTVVRGDPTAEELAALVAVLATLPANPEAAAPAGSAASAGQGPGWADRARALRAPLAPGPGAWAASARWS